jgi:hypothetical protein
MHGEKGRRCRLDAWLADVVGIQGIPMPSGEPSASPHTERLNRSLRPACSGRLHAFVQPMGDTKL